MNYLFAPFTLINQYQPYYGFASPIVIQTSAFYNSELKFQKQMAAEKQTILVLEPQNDSKLIDEDFDCTKRTKKLKKKEDKNFGFREQDKERNIYSNILKSFFVSLCQKRAMDKWMVKLIDQNSKIRDVDGVIQKIQEIFGKNRSYFSPKFVRQILKREKREQNVKNIVRSCLLRYLKHQFTLSLLLSNRIKRKSKLLQMKKARELLYILTGNQ